MNEKRIEIVESETEGVVVVRVRGVPEKPNDARFRIGYRYTNEWLGEDGYWRRTMTLISPRDWRHEGDVLELMIGPDIHGSIEANQPVRIEVPSVDAGQVLLWPSFGARADSEPAEPSPERRAPLGVSAAAELSAAAAAAAASLTPQPLVDEAPKPAATGAAPAKTPASAKSNGAAPVQADAKAPSEKAASKPAAPTAAEAPKPKEAKPADKTASPVKADKATAPNRMTVQIDSTALRNAAASNGAAPPAENGALRSEPSFSAQDPAPVVAASAAAEAQAKAGAPASMSANGRDSDGFGQSKVFKDDPFSASSDPASADPLPTGATSVRESKAAAFEGAQERSARRRSITQRKRHPKRAQNESEDVGDPYTHAAPRSRGRSGYSDTSPPSSNLGAMASEYTSGGGMARSTAIVPAPHHENDDELAADPGFPSRASRRDSGSNIWPMSLAVIIGLGVGVAGFAGYVALNSSSGSDALVAAADSAEATRMAALAQETNALRDQLAQLTNRLNTSEIGGGDGGQPASVQDAQDQVASQAVAAEANQLRADLQAALNAREQAIKRITELERTLNASEARSEALQRDTFAAEERAESLQTELTSLQQQVTALNAEGSDGGAADAAVIAEKDAALSRISVLETELGGLRSTLSEAETERDSALSQAADLQFRIAELQSSITDLERARDDAESRVAAASSADEARSDLESALVESEAAVITAERTRDEALEEVEQLRTRVAEVDALTNELARLQSAETDAQSRVADLEAALSKAQSEAEQATEAASGSQRTLDALNAAEQAREEAVQLAQATEREAAQLADRLAAAESERGQLLQQLQEARTRLNETSSGDAEAVASLQRELGYLQNQLVDMQRERDDALARLAQGQGQAPSFGSNTAQPPAETSQRPTSVTSVTGSSNEAKVDAAFAAADDLLPSRTIQRSKLRMRLLNGEPIIDSVRGELGLRYVRFDQLVDVLCQSLPDQCN
ncbi:MAG: hypothetical protein KTR21_03735 [Rhodobacteraceae bacterium]|nr:hypothetical protein [Paracoccaceae bacterium]